jgi:hypothetical protein
MLLAYRSSRMLKATLCIIPLSSVFLLSKQCVRADGDECWDGEFGTSGFEGTGVHAVEAFRGEFYVGGIFTSIGGVKATNIAKWDGRQWSAVSGVSGGTYAGVGVMRARWDGLYVAGSFTDAGGVPALNVAKGNGTNWSALGLGIDAPIFVLAASGTNLYVGGSFFSAGGIIASNVAKWDGTRWTSLGSGILFGAPSAGATTGADLFVGGDFRRAGGNPSTNIALYHIPHALNIQRAQDNVVLSWPSTGTNFWLEAATSVPSTNRLSVPQPVVIYAGQCLVTNAISSGNQFFRLRRKQPALSFNLSFGGR